MTSNLRAILFVVILLIADTFSMLPNSKEKNSAHRQVFDTVSGSSGSSSSYHQSAASSKSSSKSINSGDIPARVAKLSENDPKYHRLLDDAFYQLRVSYPDAKYKLGKPINSAVSKSDEMNIYYITREVYYKYGSNEHQRGEFMVKGQQSRSAEIRGDAPEVVTYAVNTKVKKT